MRQRINCSNYDDSMFQFQELLYLPYIFPYHLFIFSFLTTSTWITIIVLLIAIIQFASLFIFTNVICSATANDKGKGFGLVRESVTFITPQRGVKMCSNATQTLNSHRLPRCLSLNLPTPTLLNLKEKVVKIRRNCRNQP